MSDKAASKQTLIVDNVQNNIFAKLKTDFNTHLMV